MTKFIAIAALAAVTAGSAFAMTPSQLANSVQNRIDAYADVDVNSLSPAQIGALHLVLNSDESTLETRKAVEAILD